MSPSKEACERVIKHLEKEVEQARMLRWKPDMCKDFCEVIEYLESLHAPLTEKTLERWGYTRHDEGGSVWFSKSVREDDSCED